MLELSKNDTRWRELAYKICGCKSLADDIVQDMYVYLSKYKDKDFTEPYVYYTMKHLYIRCKKESEKEILTNDFRLLKKDDTASTQNRYDLLEMIEHLHLFEREVLLITHEMSLRKAEQETGIFYSKLNYHKNKGLNKLREKYGSTKG